jgi:hypothetical protein
MRCASPLIPASLRMMSRSRLTKLPKSLTNAYPIL